MLHAVARSTDAVAGASANSAIVCAGWTALERLAGRRVLSSTELAIVTLQTGTNKMATMVQDVCTGKPTSCLPVGC